MVKFIHTESAGLVVTAALLGTTPLLASPATTGKTVVQPHTGGQARTAIAASYYPTDGGQRAPWSVSPGGNTVTVNPDEISITQREARNTDNYAGAVKPLTLPKTGSWKVSFEVRFGELGSCATAVGLFNGARLIGWVGADSYYKVLGSFFGKDFFTKVDTSFFPLADTQWHRFEFRSDGSQVFLSRDGVEVGRQATTARPDTIKLGEVNLLFGEPPPLLQQTETWVRSVRTE